MAFVVIGVAVFLLSASRLVAASVPNAALPSPSARATPSPHAGKGPDDVIGRHCGGIGPVPDGWCGCIWGAVYFQDDPDHPLEGVTVEIHYGGDYVSDVTSYGIEEDFPYFAESADRLGAGAGDTLTLVARWGEYQTSLDVVASPDESGEQRVDLVFPFPAPTTTPTPTPTPPTPANPEGWPRVRYDSLGSRFYPYSTTFPISNQFVKVWSQEVRLHLGSVLGVATGDVNGDGWLEIVVPDGNRLRLFSHEGLELWSRDIPGVKGPYQTGELRILMLADVTGDGNPEIFVSRKATDTEAVTYVYDGNGDLLPSWRGSTGTRAVAADGYLIGGDLFDSRRALMPLGSNFAANPRGATMVDMATGSHLWTYRTGWQYEVSIADMENDGIREMVNTQWSAVHNGAYGCGLGWNTCTDDSHLWIVLIDENGREILTWQPPGNPWGGELTARIVDLDADGQKEIAVVEGHWSGARHSGTSRIFLLDRNGDELDRYEGGQDLEWKLAGVADVNSDGYDELVLDGAAGIRLFDRHLDPLAENPDFQFVSALNDINGDGQIEVIVTSWANHELAVLGPDLQPLWRDATFDGPLDAIVSDLTGDGANEIIAYSQSEIRIYAHQEEPFPTPTPAPTPTPTGKRTLILVNEERLEVAYADDPEELAALHQLTSTLQTLAAHSAVSGTIVHLEEFPDVVAAYDAWLPDPRSPVTDTAQSNAGANAVADAVLSVIEDYIESDPTYWNILLVGDDRIIPFRRVPDASPPYFYESTYNPIVVSTTVGAAMAENYILTDDFYGDLVPNGVPVPVAYIPDHPVGRLVERPSEMVALVEAFLAHDGTIPADPALVVGHDLVADAARVERDVLQGDGIATEALIGDGWTTDQFREVLLEMPHHLSAINTHSRHDAYAAPSGRGVRAREMVTATYPFSGSVAFSLGCHAGLNVPPEYGLDAALDLPEALAGRGVGYIANTGWGIGDRRDIAYSEALVTQLTAQLTQGDSATLGEALLASKLAYIADRGILDGIDEKVLLQFTLYGLPMYRLQSGAGRTSAGPVPHTAPPLLGEAEANDPGLTRVTVWYRPNEHSFERHDSPDGVYYTLDGQYQAGHNSPLEPRHFAEPNVSGGLIHGAVFRGGLYADTTDFDPLVSAASIITGGIAGEGIVSATNWYPAIPFQVLNIHPSLESRKESFVVQFGQFRPADERFRLFSQMSFDLYYSTSDDFTPPTVDSSSSLYDGLLQVGVVATDPSGIHAALVAYSSGDGHWRSIEMDREGGSDTWRVLIPVSPDMEYFIQVVDGAGNVTIDDNGGLYYRAPFTQEVYLPLVLRGWP